MDTGFPSDDDLADIFTTTNNGNVVGLRISQILSFTYTNNPPSLKIRYISEPSLETFEGEMAIALLHGLRQLSRLMRR